MSAEKLNARDLAIEEQLNFISKQSAPKELANKPLKIKSDITREMIEDFKAEQEGSVFHPPSILPVLETFKPVDVPEKERIDADKEVYLKRIADYDREIDSRVKVIPEVKQKYNEYMQQLQADSLKARTQGSNAPQLLKQIEIDKRRSTEDFNKAMQQIESEIAEFESFKNIADAQLNRLDKVLGRADELKQQNEGEKARVERLNRQAVKTFEDEINTLNKGLNINQQVGESDSDYFTRIQNMKDARYSQEVSTQATTFNIKRFKTNMKEILTIPESALEKIIKYLDKDKMLYEANKKFSLIKSSIEKTYGVNPRFKAGDENDLYMFIYNTLTKQFEEKEQAPVIVASVSSKNIDLLSKSKTGFIPKSKLMTIYSSITGKKSFVGTATQLANEIIRLRELEPTFDTRSVKTYSSALIGKPFNIGQPSPEQDLTGFKKKGRPAISDELKAMRAEEANTRAFLKAEEKKKLKSVLKKVGNISSPPVSPRQTTITSFVKGKGVEREFYPKLVPFGAITISPAQLFYYKQLRVREPTKHSIRGMPDIRVSDDMVYILMKIINGGIPSMTELKALSEDEKSLYDAVITKAKLHKEMPNTSPQSIDKLKKRLELCEGEWNAGNDNTKIKKELNSIIRQLTELKAITEVEGRKYLKQF